jgi:hypothetical protein
VILRIRRFARFALIWYAQQFAIPFWIVGHVHLHLVSYHDALEAFLSFVMHAAVAAGFWLDWVDHRDAPGEDEPTS